MCHANLIFGNTKSQFSDTVDVRVIEVEIVKGVK